MRCISPYGVLVPITGHVFAMTKYMVQLMIPWENLEKSGNSDLHLRRLCNTW